MTIIQCKLCRKPFSSSGSKFCIDCLRQIELDFLVVKEFIYDNRRADIETIARETGVSKMVIQHLIREGRFYYEDVQTEGAGVYKCKVCGKPAAGSDKICRDCKANISTSLKTQMERDRQKKQTTSQAAAPPAGRGIGMHTVGRKTKK